MSKKKRLRHPEETDELARVYFGREIDGLNFKIYCKFDFNETHKRFLQLLDDVDTKMVMVDGPAGSGKTYLSVLAGLKHLSQRHFEKIVYIRSIAESAAKSIGSLPGELDEKFKPWSIPLMEKLSELIDRTTIANLMEDNRIECVPVNFVRGMTFHDSFVIIDEAQNLDFKELTSCLTRFGNNTQYVVIGDAKQADIGERSGFTRATKAFADVECIENGIYSFKFTEDDIVRSAILKLIARKLGAV